jgi:hypothetical protein
MPRRRQALGRVLTAPAWRVLSATYGTEAGLMGPGAISAQDAALLAATYELEPAQVGQDAATVATWTTSLDELTIWFEARYGWRAEYAASYVALLRRVVAE